MRKIFLFFLIISFSLCSYAQRNVKTKCTIMHTSDYCIPCDSLKFPNVLLFDSAYTHTVVCGEINKLSAAHAVHLVLTRRNGRVFRLETGFKNISLIKKSDGNILHPIAINFPYYSVDDSSKYVKYLTSDFVVSRCVIKFHFKKYIDMVLIFPEANVGDKVVIKDYVETEIQE